MNSRWSWRLNILGCALVAGLLTGCDGDCSPCGGETVVVAGGPPVVTLYPYSVAVLVTDRYGYSLGGATVELTVAMVPEQRFVGVTSPEGVALFSFDAPPDVVAIAYACAPGYRCNAGDVGTRPDRGDLSIAVALR